MADFRKRLQKLLKANPGNTTLEVYLSDKATGYNLTFYSKKFRVGVNNDFILELERLGIPYKVNKK